MKAKIVAFFILILALTTQIFGQDGVAITGDVSLTPFEQTPGKFSTYMLFVRVNVSDDITAIASGRTSRSREVSVPNPDKSPADAGFIGIAYTTRFFEIAPMVGLEQRENPNNKDVGWIVGVEGFLGYVNKDNFFMSKQAYIYYRVEKGQFDKSPYADIRFLFPFFNKVAAGARYESDMGFGLHGEFKIPIAEKETYKAIYLYTSYYMQEKIALVGMRLTIN